MKQHSRIRALILASSLSVGTSLSTGTASAQQAYRVDEAFTWFHVEDTPHEGQHASNDGWRLAGNFRAFGTVTADSVLKMTVKQGRRIIGSARCGSSNTPGTPGLWTRDCGSREADWGASAPHETAVGEYDVELRWVDGQTDQETLLKTFHVRVGMVTRVTEGNFRPMANRYYVDADHRLLDSAVRMVGPGNEGYFYDRESRMTSADRNMVEFLTVISPRDMGSAFTSADVNLRCTVDGQPVSIPSDQAPGVVGARSWAVATRANGRERAEEPFDWRQVTYRLPLTWGPAEMRMPGHAVLDEHNGQWQCELRRSGQTLRVFRFTVAAGRVAAHPEEAAGLSLAPETHFVESYLSNAPIGNERAYQPNAFRSGGFYGHAWTSPEARRFAQSATRVPAVTVTTTAAAAATGATGAAASIRFDDGFALFRTGNHIEPVNGRPTNLGWNLIANARVLQAVPARSTFRFVTKRGNRVVGDQRCEATVGTQSGADVSWVQDCGNVPAAYSGSPMRVTDDGEFTVEVHLIDGQTDRDSLVKTQQIIVHPATNVRNGGQPDATSYYISLNGLITASLIERVPQQSYPYPNPLERTFAGTNDVWVHFWASVPEDGGPFVDINNSLRCTVNGQPLTLPNTRGQAMPTHRITAVHTAGRGPNPPRNIIDYRYFSMKLPFTWGAANLREQQAVVLEDHPGAYSCDWRSSGQTLRTFRWTVSADGTIAPHAEETAGLNLGPQVHLVDTILPSTPRDVQTGPAETRAGSFFGRAWTTPAGRAVGSAIPAVGAAFLAR